MSTDPTTISRVEDGLPVLLSYRQAAALLGIGERTLFAWQKSGRCPPPRKIGATKKSPAKFVRDELTAWAAAGCPPVDHTDREAEG